MEIAVSPGSGSVLGASEADANRCMQAFRADLAQRDMPVAATKRHSERDESGRFAFQLFFADGRVVEVEMPGLPVERVRWMGLPWQDIWDYPRLYVDGSSWLWRYALSVCESRGDDV